MNSSPSGGQKSECFNSRRYGYTHKTCLNIRGEPGMFSNIFTFFIDLQILDPVEPGGHFLNKIYEVYGEPFTESALSSPSLIGIRLRCFPSIRLNCQSNRLTKP